MMSQKTVNVFVGIFALVLFAGFALSLDVFTVTNINFPSAVDHDQGSFEGTFTVSYTGEKESIDVEFTLEMTSGQATLTSPTSITLTQGVPQDLTAVVEYASGQSGRLTGVITATPSSGTAVDIPFDILIREKSELSVTPNSQSVGLNETGQITLTNNGNTNLNNIVLSHSTGDYSLEFNPSGTISLTTQQKTKTVTITPIIADLNDLRFGTRTLTITAKDTAENVEDTSTFTLKRSFCTAGHQGSDLRIKSASLKNRGDGDSDEEWLLLDEVELEVEVENRGSEDIRDVMVELALFDSEGVNQVSDLEFHNDNDEEIDFGKIKEGKDQTETFSFRVPVDLDEGNYRLALKAYSDDLGEDVECVDTADDFDEDFYQNIDVSKQGDDDMMVVVDDIELPEQLACGETATVSFTVFNIGDTDQEDMVKVTAKSTNLGINEEFEINGGIDEGDDESIEFTFTVPQGIDNGNYNIDFKTYYEYDDGFYDQVSKDTFRKSVEIFGCSSSGNGGGLDTLEDFTISALLDSNANAGEQLLVKATITNTGSETKSVLVNALGYQSWSDLRSITPQVVSLGPGQSSEVTLAFNVNDDASGAESFNLQLSEGGRIKTQEVEVFIGNSAGPGITGGFIGTLTEGSGLIWIIGAVNVILIILIIVVAVRLARR